MPKKKRAEDVQVTFDTDVARRIRQHARGNLKTEVCGVLIGSRRDDIVLVTECIAGENAAQAGTHVTFTQETWGHVYKVKDARFPEDRIVGWYHSHPGFGVFLSEHDAFIHKNFFSSPDQIAWVFDPHSDEEGCFGWIGDRLERVGSVRMSDRRGGEEVRTDGRTEPSPVDSGHEDQDSSNSVRVHSDADVEPAAPARQFNLAVAILTHISAIIVGLLVAWFIFPRIMIVPVPVDPQTGVPLTQPVQPPTNPGTK